MKLARVHVRMFRNVLDSSLVAIQPDVTCLVGKNESGKTAFLQALWRLNPARLSPKFDIPEHYPAWLEKRHRLEGKTLEDVAPVEAVFSWEPADRDAVAQKFGHDVAPADGSLTFSKTYKNDFDWEHGCNEKQAVANLVEGFKLPDQTANALKGVPDFAALRSELEKQLGQAGDSLDAHAALQQLEQKRRELLGDNGFADALWNILVPRVAKFFYFADYSKLPYTTKIARVLGTTGEQLNESEATARALLRLGGAEHEYLLNPDYERRKRELENVANALTEDVLKYWTQNKELRVQPEITQRTEQDARGMHSVLDELKIRIWDGRHSLSLPFDQHSAGFQWFFSFLAAFSEYEYSSPPVIILLDEPAVGLHAKAQDDFLRFIEERLTKRCQVIYTTHSPFMIQPGKLERVRMVEDRGKDEGSTVSSEVLSRDPDTLFPLQGALGYDLVQHLFISPHNIVVEGTSDYTYLRVISDHLAQQNGRVALSDQWSIVPVGGADAIPTFVALLGKHLNVTVLVDSRREGHQRLTKMATEGYLAKKRIILVGEILGQKLGDIEDLFEVDEYLDLYNRAFGAALTASQLTGTDPIVNRIARHLGIERYDHGRPSDILLRHRDELLPKLSDATLNRFERLFERINQTLTV